MKPPSLTIGIPTRNRSSLVGKLVEACLKQTLLPLEIVLSDNASDDDTISILNKFAHPCLKVYRQSQNIGMVGNWNACLEQASGDWFMLLSDDDMIDQDFVEQFQLAIANGGDVDLLIMRCNIVDQITNETNENYPPTNQAGPVDFVSSIFPAWLDNTFLLPLSGMLFRTATLRSLGGFSDNLPFAADIATWLPIALHRHTSFWPHKKISYVVHDGMTTRTFDANTLIYDMIRVRELISSEIQKLPAEHVAKARLEKLADVRLRRSFGDMMIISARRNVSKVSLVAAWIRYCHHIPRLGFTPLSVGAVVVPYRLLQSIGWPYRQLLKMQRRRASYLRRRLLG